MPKNYFLYKILIYIAYPFLFIIFLINSIINRDLKEGNFSRMGLKYPKESFGQSIWIHGASVGEVSCVKEIVNMLIAKNYTIYLSTTTYTGYEIAKKIYGDSVIIFYNTLDVPFMVKKLIKKISPEYVLIAEIEIWPSMLYELSKRYIPIYLINGRIGQKELKGYLKAKWVLKPYYKLYTKIFAQSATDKKNMLLIGMPEEAITISGNLKYDIEYNLIKEKYNAIKNIPPKRRFVIVAGSTHEGEEEAILKAIDDAGLKNKVYIVIVPRNILRYKEIEDQSRKLGYNLSLYSRSKKESEEGIIINVIGELLYWYKRADLAIMGGSFTKSVGGHNMLEPVYFKTATIVGPHIDNFKDMYEYMKETLFNCEDIKDLSPIIKQAYENKDLRTTLGILSNKLLIENRGSSEKTMGIIERFQGRI